LLNSIINIVNSIDTVVPSVYNPAGQAIRNLELSSGCSTSTRVARENASGISITSNPDLSFPQIIGLFECLPSSGTFYLIRAKSSTGHMTKLPLFVRQKPRLLKNPIAEINDEGIMYVTRHPETL